MIILGGPFLVFCLVVGAILYSRARDQAPRCPACRRVVPSGATRCPHCTSDIAATFTLAEQRAYYRQSGAAAQQASAEPRPLASPAGPRVRWGVIAGIVAAFAVVVALLGLGVVLMDRRADSAAARRSAEEAAAARQPAAPEGAPPSEFSAEVHRLAIDRAEAAAAASRASERPPPITRRDAATEEPALPATHRPQPVSPPPDRDGLALLAAQQRARYDEEARTKLAAQGADVAQQAPVEASPPVAESGHRVVLRDGSAVASKDLPRLAGNAVIFTDMRNRLVSMRASEVNLRATEAANGVRLRPQPPR